MVRTLAVVMGGVFVLGWMPDVQSAPPPIAAREASAPGSQPVYPLWDGNETVATYAKRAGIKQSQLLLDLGKGGTLKMTLIPAGQFLMGSPATEDSHYKGEAQHEVTLTKPFYMGIYDVTQRQYQAVMGQNPSQFKGANNPVETVSWDDAIEFCKKLSVRTGKAVQLPTEARWEYACRAGTKTAFSTGETISTEQANFNGNVVYGHGVKGTFRQRTTPVGHFKPNPWGLYDMHGNVWQWCQDRYADLEKEAVADPTGPDAGAMRVLRGGSWAIPPRNLRSASRHSRPPETRNDLNGGFRVVVELGQR